MHYRWKPLMNMKREYSSYTLCWAYVMIVLKRQYFIIDNLYANCSKIRFLIHISAIWCSLSSLAWITILCLSHSLITITTGTLVIVGAYNIDAPDYSFFDQHELKRISYSLSLQVVIYWKALFVHELTCLLHEVNFEALLLMFDLNC